MTGFSLNISLRWTLTAKNKHIYSYQLVLSSLKQKMQMTKCQGVVAYATVFDHQDYQLDKCCKTKL